MPLPKQTSNFPGYEIPDRSWSNNLRALAANLFPQGILKGLALGIPSGNSLVPTLTDGYVINGDEVVGPLGSKLVPAAPANATRLGLYYGLEGMFYATAAQAKVEPNPMYQDQGVPVARGVLVGEVSTNSQTLTAITQYRHLDTSRFSVRSVLRPYLLPKGTDVLLAELILPQPTMVRLSYAVMRIAAALTGSGTGDSARLRHSPVGNNPTVSDWASYDTAALGGAVGSQSAHNTPVYSAGPVDGIRLYWNLTDADNSITAGMVELNAVLELM